MADLDYLDDVLVIINSIHNAIIALADSVAALDTSELFATRRPWLYR